MPTIQPYQRLNEELAHGEEKAAQTKKPETPTYTFKFKAPSGRWFTVTACDETIRELLLPGKWNKFAPLLKNVPSIVPNPLPPCLQSKEQTGREHYPEAA